MYGRLLHMEGLAHPNLCAYVASTRTSSGLFVVIHCVYLWLRPEAEERDG
jgi:hypothetical protein